MVKAWCNLEYRKTKLNLLRDKFWDAAKSFEIEHQMDAAMYDYCLFVSFTYPHVKAMDTGIYTALKRDYHLWYKALLEQVTYRGGSLLVIKVVGMHADGLNPHLHILIMSTVSVKQEWVRTSWAHYTGAAPKAISVNQRTSDLNIKESLSCFHDLETCINYMVTNLDYEHGPARRRFSMTIKRGLTLTESEREDYEELAGKMEFEGGHDRKNAEKIALKTIMEKRR